MLSIRESVNFNRDEMLEKEKGANPANTPLFGLKMYVD